jgi:predicted nucleotidyltransferase component of viral defense system
VPMQFQLITKKGKLYRRQMIDREEIEEKAKEFEINISNVERDYVFGWILCGIYTISDLKNVLILKGGNGFRKAYFSSTRFSADLDFSTQSPFDRSLVLKEFEKICDFVQEMTGVIFEKDRNKIEEKPTVDREVNHYEAKIYFKDFYGNSNGITISVKLDIKEFDKIYLPIQDRNLIHPYSDSGKCVAQVKCLKLEEMLAAKLKCLLQRRHSFDLYDYVYAVFINNELDVNRAEIVSTFLKKTIFGRSPGVVRGLLLGLPFQVFRAAWDKYVVCPKQSVISFDTAMEKFVGSIQELFGEETHVFLERLFYPAEMRNLILEAGGGRKLMNITYNGYSRVVEPYSLVYKRRKDGHAEEYFYVWDRTGGSSEPGIKTFFNTKISDMKVLEESFEPRYPVELAKAGEPAGSGYFSKPNFEGDRQRVRKSSSRGYREEKRYTVQCPYCEKTFRRSIYDRKLNNHKDNYGNNCHGRAGYIV